MWFKTAFAIAFTFATVVAATTARKAAHVHGAPVNQLGTEIRGLIIVRAALGIVFYAALAVWLFRPQSFPWAVLPIPPGVRWTAVALLVPVMWFFAASFRALDINYRGGVGLYDHHSLVTSGPYRYVRHPIYIAFIAIMLLVLVVSSNWVLGVSGFLLVTSIAVARIPVEERQLQERFGSTWDDYRARTNSIIPGLW
jgi:protein-S-isoprenylcysteine O-methyltransferase Ste14